MDAQIGQTEKPQEGKKLNEKTLEKVVCKPASAVGKSRVW